MATKRQIDPIARFMQEHDEALVQLAALNKSTRSVAEDGFSEDAYSRCITGAKKRRSFRSWSDMSRDRPS